MKTGFVIAAALIIVAAASLGIQNAMAKGIPWQAGYDHGCSDAKLNILCEIYQSTQQRSKLSHTRIYEWI
ncbi:MAG: hypothetical protein ACJ72X_07395 [Nitrososphaeraceae archaeon]